MVLKFIMIGTKLKEVNSTDSWQLVPKFISEKPETSCTYLNNFLGELASKQMDSSAHTIDFFILSPALRKKFCMPGRKKGKRKKRKEMKLGLLSHTYHILVTKSNKFE